MLRSIPSRRIAVVALAALCGVTAQAQDAPSRAPNFYRVLFENERVRVLDATYPAGAKSATHFHSPLVAYAVQDARFRLFLPDGEPVDAELPAGQALWSEASIHAAKNIGAEPSRAIVFELKDAPIAGALETAEDNAVRVAPDRYRVLVENDRIRAFELVVDPGEVHAMHSHLPMVVHVLEGGKIEHELPDGKKEVVAFTAGKTVAAPASRHRSRNVGDTRVRLVAVELKEVSRTEANLAVTRRMVDEVVNDGDGDAMARFFDADVVYHGPGGRDAKGLEANRERIAAFRAAFPDIHVALDGTIATGDTVVARYAASGTHLGPLNDGLPTGRSVRFSGMALLRFADSKVVEVWEQFDQLGLMQQLGAIPAGKQ